MNFEEALKFMKMGSKVSREAWRGTVSYWHIVLYKDRDYFVEFKPDGSSSRLFDAVELDDLNADDWFLVT